MKLKRLVLEAPLPREVQPTSTTWAQVVPSAQYTSDKAELDYDPTTALVRIKTPHSLRMVHVSRVLFMEPEEKANQLDEAYKAGLVSPADYAKAMYGLDPETIPPLPKRRGMPKGGWPKKDGSATHAAGRGGSNDRNTVNSEAAATSSPPKDPT